MNQGLGKCISEVYPTANHILKHSYSNIKCMRERSSYEEIEWAIVVKIKPGIGSLLALSSEDLKQSVVKGFINSYFIIAPFIRHCHDFAGVSK